MKKLILFVMVLVLIGSANAATYYIDCDSGSDSNAGTSTGAAWASIEKYTTTTSRSAGDIAYVRAGTTCSRTDDLDFDEDGTESNPISIIGTNSTNGDHWGDGIDTRPVIDFQANSASVYFSSDNYWVWDNIDVTDSEDYGGGIYITSGVSVEISNVEISDGATSYCMQFGASGKISNILCKNADDGIRISDTVLAKNIECENLEIYGNCISSSRGIVYINGFTYDGSGDEAIYVSSGGVFHIYNQEITGVNNPETDMIDEIDIISGAGSINLYENGNHYIFGDTTSFYAQDTVTRSGGGSYALKFNVLSSYGDSYTLNTAFPNGQYRIWFPSGTSTTATFYARKETSTSYNSDQFGVEGVYFDGDDFVTISSSESFDTSSGVWDSFTVTINPSTSQWVPFWWKMGYTSFYGDYQGYVDSAVDIS